MVLIENNSPNYGLTLANSISVCWQTFLYFICNFSIRLAISPIPILLPNLMYSITLKNSHISRIFYQWMNKKLHPEWRWNNKSMQDLSFTSVHFYFPEIIFLPDVHSYCWSERVDSYILFLPHHQQQRCNLHRKDRKCSQWIIKVETNLCFKFSLHLQARNTNSLSKVSNCFYFNIEKVSGD